jgi:hypothetical protein
MRMIKQQLTTENKKMKKKYLPKTATGYGLKKISLVDMKKENTDFDLLNDIFNNTTNGGVNMLSGKLTVDELLDVDDMVEELI